MFLPKNIRIGGCQGQMWILLHSALADQIPWTQARRGINATSWQEGKGHVLCAHCHVYAQPLHQAVFYNGQQSISYISYQRMHGPESPAK